MSRLDVNRSGEMEVFTRVVELGGFSTAARAFRMTPSAVSKLVARLEARLGVRLINRSTRKLQLTPEGESHNRLGTNYRRQVPDWPLRVDGKLLAMPLNGSVRAGDGETLRRLVLEGVGIGRLSLYHVRADLAAGRLVPVLESFNPHEIEPIHAVCLGKAGRLPARVRAVLDFLVACSGVGDGRYTRKRTAPMPGNSAVT
jgi:DNA-binding transcriptional LysR family regulator